VSTGFIRLLSLRNLDTKTFQSCGGSGTVSRQAGFICLGIAPGNDAKMCSLKYRVIVYENVKINSGESVSWKYTTQRLALVDCYNNLEYETNFALYNRYIPSLVWPKSFKPRSDVCDNRPSCSMARKTKKKDDPPPLPYIPTTKKSDSAV